MNASAPKHSAAKATLRQLAVLGLPGPMLWETIARVMPRLVPCEMVAFQDLDDAGRFIGAWINMPEMIPELSVYLEHFHNAREAEAHTTFDEFFRSGTPIDKMHDGCGDYLGSALYNELYRQVDFRYIVRAAFRDGTTPRGCIMMWRGHGARDYSPAEMRLIAGVAPYLTHALAAPPADSRDRESIEVNEGTLICNGQGVVEFASTQGRVLLHDIAEASMTAATLSDRCLHWAAPQLRRLIGEAKRLSEGRPGSVPAIVKQNRRGKYVLRVWRLAAAGESGAPDLFSVSIRRYIPTVLRLLEHPAVVALPAREKEICLRLADGAETKEIAAGCGLSIHTVISYMRSLYDRLGVSGREQLLARLLETPTPRIAEDR